MPFIRRYLFLAAIWSNIMNHLSRWRAIAITPLAVLCMTSAIAQAEFVPIFPSFERQDSFDRDYKWNFVSPTTREDGKIWFTTLTDKLNPDFSHDLTATIRHTATGPLFTLSFNGLKQPVLGKTDILAEAQQANHGADAVDMVRATVALNLVGSTPQGAVSLSGDHEKVGGVGFVWSLGNSGKTPLKGVVVTPSYREAG